MATTHSDANFLCQDPGFQGRIRAALISYCIVVSKEGWSVPFHQERAQYASQVLNSPDTYKLLFSNTVATDPFVIGPVTAAGTVVLTAGNVATQAALVGDVDIDNTITTQFNSFFRTPG